jgi:hypothetical protein
MHRLRGSGDRGTAEHRVAQKSKVKNVFKEIKIKSQKCFSRN